MRSFPVYLLALVLSLLLTLTTVAEEVEGPSVCNSCGGDITGTRLWDFCNSDAELKVVGRCCMNSSTVVGIDLHNCSLTETGLRSTVKNLVNLQYLSVEENPIGNVTVEDLKDQTDLVYFSMPATIACPGGLQLWRSVADKKQPKLTICRDLLDPCSTRNVTCPEDSHCHHSGLNSTQCLCDDGFHGYKCMNEGEFPIVPFIAGLVAPTVVLSIFLYVTQRRFVVKKNK